MAKVADRVQETTTTTGTGTLTLAGAKTGYRAFSAAFSNGDTVYYCITDGTNWEVGSGVFTTSGTTLTRANILASSNAGSAVSWGAGSKDVFCTAPAAHVGGALGNEAIGGIKTATFNSEPALTTTTGAVTVDWSAAQNHKQNEPTGSITYTFTAPPGVGRLQLRILSDGTSAAQTITWPASVKWLGATWAAAANKGAIVTFWYDGTDYWAMGANQV